jgi:hypothetical protein
MAFTEKALLTNSRLKAARMCQRYHHLRYELGWRAVSEAHALRFGTLVHKGLEAWWRATEDRLQAALHAMEGEADPFDLVRAEELLRGYDLRWSDEPFEVISVEAKFQTELRNPATGAPSRTWELAGKIDAVVRDLSTDLVRLVEHKTSGEDIGPGSDYVDRLKMDGQVSVYFEGAASLGHEVADCIYDVLGKPLLRPSEVPQLDETGTKVVLDASGQRVRTKDGKKWRQTGDTELGYVLQTRPETPEEFRLRINAAIASDPERYYQRAQVVRLEGEMKGALLDIWQLAQQIREAQLAGRAPKNPDACVRYGRRCEFFQVCSGAASLDDAGQFERTETIHPELEEASP